MNHDYSLWLDLGIMAAFAVALVLWAFVMAVFEQNRRKDKPGDRQPSPKPKTEHSKEGNTQWH